MRTNHYRTISQWFWWEDLDFPNPGVEARIRKNVEAAAAAKVELAVVFGYHFRWDYIYNFDLVHKLIAFAVEEYHKHGIKVIDHHSAVLTYRPRNWNDRRENFDQNHHHVPMTPDPAIIDDLSYAGKKINSFRQLRTDDNTPLFLPTYHCEIYCTNNPDFRYAYRSYIQRLFSETGIDGLMCDDVGKYGRWNACGCQHCRQKYRNITGKTLPPTDDFTFWGNYDNPDFRQWVTMHIDDGRDFLAMVRDSIPQDALLTSCCSSSTSRLNDCVGLDMSVWESSLNTMMLEMCGNISGDKNSIESRIPDMLLNCGIAERRNLPCLGLGYAFFPDEGFRTWSLNKFFNSDSWISSHKTRCGLTIEEQRQLPDEPEIVHEAYNFDARYPELSELTDTAETAVYYSCNSRNFNGSFSGDYVDALHGIIKMLFRKNIAFEVTPIIPETPAKIKVLIISDADCLSGSERQMLDRFIANGGKVVIVGLCGGRDESGADFPDGSYLKKYGIEPLRPQLDRTLSQEDKEKFFTWRFFGVSGDVPAQLDHTANQPLPAADKYGFYQLADNVYWSPLRANCAEQAANTADLANSMLVEKLQITLPDTLRYRIYIDRSGNYIVHFMPVNITGNLHKEIRLHKTGSQIVESLNYGGLSGKVQIAAVNANVAGCTLYAADLPEARSCAIENGTAQVELQGLKRFFSVKLELQNK
ncbi:MAG: hypothetical protein E7052_02515 [Lentisphaerae bacterium]|nr:hypothetical protein [Lentisphaerota bacterium]